MELTISSVRSKMCHKEWRKVAKRERRRKMRRQKAIQIKEEERTAQLLLESTAGYESWRRQQEALEMFERMELERINREENEKWLRAELVAQALWEEQQKKIERARLERTEQEIRIRKEWEQEQQKIMETRKKIKEIEEQTQKNNEMFMEKLELFASGDTDSLPDELMTSRESKPNTELCPFFSKTASCRFGDVCSRNHVYPGVSKVLLAANFYTQFDTDMVLDYDDADTYREFKNFFFDVLPEFEKFGEVVQFKVCSNWEKHLRGNMYVEYAELRPALAAYRALHTRWYAGRQLSLAFCNVQSWSNAICGMFLGRRCPKGRSCNFLHVFKNPDQIFDRRLTKRASTHLKRDKENARNWRWSESPEPVSRERSCHSSRSPPISRRDRSTSRRRRQSSSSSRKYRRQREEKRHSKSDRNRRRHTPEKVK